MINSFLSGIFEQSHCTKLKMVFKKHCVVPLNLNPSSTERIGNYREGGRGFSMAKKLIKEMYEVVLVVFYSNYNFQSGGSIPSVEVRYG